jgi:predicted transcriptional regulator
MAWTAKDITETELAVLRLLWKEGPSTIRALTDRLYPEGTHSHYATVQSLLDRLEAKDCVSRTKDGRRNVFTATISRGELITRRLRETAESLCDGSVAPLLSHLTREVDLEPEELETLSKLVERLDREVDRGSNH